MKKNHGHEILNDFSKEVIIEFLRRNFFASSFRRSELLFVKWDLTSQKLLEEGKMLGQERKKIDRSTPAGHKKWLENMRLETELQGKWSDVDKILAESHRAAKEEEKS